MKTFALLIELVGFVVLAVEEVVLVDCVVCIIMASTRYIAARIVSTLCSTLNNCLACSSTSSMAECLLL